MKQPDKTLILLLIIIVGIVLRFCQLSEISFSHDEISALLRLNFNSFQNLITHGVKLPDNHPAGIQVFLYYYTKWFGTNSLIVKFPFVLAGIISIGAIFKIGSLWLNKTSALWAAAIFAVSQYTISFSLEARPYSMGGMLVLLMFYCWQNVVFVNPKRLIYYVGYIVAGALCLYIHYFLFLLVFSVYLTGWFFIPNKMRIRYIIAGLLIGVLFIPHIQIFLYQLGKGGIESWIGPFSWNYLIVYFLILIQHSWFTGGVIVLTFLLFFNSKFKKSENRIRIIFIGQFLFTFLIGGLYSSFFQNVLHYRSLFFVYPFLLLFLASFVKSLSFKKSLLLIVGTISVFIFSLIVERHHYYLETNKRIPFVANTAFKWAGEAGNKATSIIKITKPEMDRFYKNQQVANTHYFTNEESLIKYDSAFRNDETDYLFIGSAIKFDHAVVSLARELYGKEIKKKFTVLGEAWLFDKNNKQRPVPWKIKTVDLEKIPGLKKESEITLLSNLSVNDLIFSKNNIIDLQLILNTTERAIDGEFKVSLYNEEGTLFSQSTIFSEVPESLPPTVSLTLRDISINNRTKIEVTYNGPGNLVSHFKQLKISTWPGNPFHYGHLKKIDWQVDRYFN